MKNPAQCAGFKLQKEHVIAREKPVAIRIPKTLRF